VLWSCARPAAAAAADFCGGLLNRLEGSRWGIPERGALARSTFASFIGCTDGFRRYQGSILRKPFGQPIKTREAPVEALARPVLGYSEVYCVAVQRAG
jgi:hypothetical protein